MAMITWLQMIDDDEMKLLTKEPTRINALNKPARESSSTYYFCAVNYFLTGDAYPSAKKDKPLTVMLSGMKGVACPTVESAYINFVPAAMAPAIVRALEKINRKALKKKIDAAEDGDLDDAEVYDFEIGEEGDDRAKIVLSEIDSLLAFYRAVAKKKRNVVIYTS